MTELNTGYLNKQLRQPDRVLSDFLRLQSELKNETVESRREHVPQYSTAGNARVYPRKHFDVLSFHGNYWRYTICWCYWLLYDSDRRVVDAASPEFRVTEDGPHDINVTAGHSVSIHCRTHAKPSARVTWYQNGDPLNRTY